ncbi:MAG: DUF4968 domain-containing protein [Chitinispirillaceae bacterium]|nr:DUF4968 domain-containing protein [Chitinispirillaceae bacterium]
MNRTGLFIKAARYARMALLTLVPAVFAGNVGNYTAHEWTPGSNQIDFSTGGTQKVRIYVCSPEIIRVSIDDRGLFTSERDVLGMEDVNREWPAVEGLTVTDETPGATGTITIATSALNVKVQKTPFRISYFKTDGTFLTADTLTGMNSTGSAANKPTFIFTQTPEEHYFGWGLAFQQFRTGYHEIDHKGETFSIRRSTACYMYSTGGYGMWFMFAEPYPNSSAWGDISNPTTGTGFDLRGKTAKYWMNPSTDPANGGMMEYASYYFLLGNWKQAMSNYTLVSGRPPRLGKKFYGIFRDMYFRSGTTVETFRSWKDMFRQNRFNIDWIRMDNFFDWTNLGYLPTVPNPGCWDPAVPDVIQEYRDAGYLFGGMSAGWGYYGCCSDNCTNNPLDDTATCKTAFDHGFDFAWYDAMNYQGREQAKEQWDTWVKVKGGDETKVFISRGWQALSSQSWPGNHMGDFLNDPYIYAVFPSALQEALVGYAWSHCDLGEGYDFGYMGYTLRPLVTIHMAGGAGGTATNFEECGNIGSYPEDMKDVIRKWGNEHYKLIPYLFSYGMKAHWEGIPVTRGMMCQNGGELDPNTYDLQYQAYVGEELIWSPYYKDLPGDENTGIRHGIYLPQVASGAWYDYYLGNKYDVSASGQSINYTCDPGQGRASLRLPVFVKAGSIIPLMDTLQFIGEKPENLITLQVWPTGGTGTDANGGFILYEDEGTSSTVDDASKTVLSYNYYHNETTPSTVVHIGAFAGSKYCADASTRNYRVEVHNIPAPTTVTSAGTELTQITGADYNAGTPGWYFNEANGGICYINASGDASTGFDVTVGPSIAVREPARRHGLNLQQVAVLKCDRSLKVTVPFTGEHTIEVMNIQGRRITKLSGKRPMKYSIPLGNKASTMYMIRISAGGKSIVRKVTL